MTEAYTAIISLPEVTVVISFLIFHYHYLHLYLHSLLFPLCHCVNIYSN